MLYERMFEPFVFLEKRHVPDGEGGFVESYENGYEFEGTAVLDTTLQARIAEKDGLYNVYTVYTRKKVRLAFGDIVKRVSDGMALRITSNGYEKTTPAGSAIDLNAASAERWELT